MTTPSISPLRTLSSTVFQAKRLSGRQNSVALSRYDHPRRRQASRRTAFCTDCGTTAPERAPART